MTSKQNIKKLIETLKKKGIHNTKVLDAISKIPREFLVAKNFMKMAYEDIPLPIDCEQTISQPSTVAYMTQELDPKEGEKVLEIGTGSGYQALVLAIMGCKVYTIERIEHLFKRTQIIFNEINLGIESFLGDGTLGLPEFAPFNYIIVTAAAPHVPMELLKQLAQDGKMIVPVGDSSGQKMILIKKFSETNLGMKEVGDFKFVPLIGKDGFKE